MSRWDGQPQDVAGRGRLARGEALGQLEHLGREDRLFGDDGADRGQPSGVLGDVAALDDVAGPVTSGEADLDPDPRLGRLVQLLGHEVLEGAVEMDQPRVDEDPCDGDGQQHGANLTGRGVSARDGGGCRPPPQAPAAARSASTFVVCSHGKGLSYPGASVRPKWP